MMVFAFASAGAIVAPLVVQQNVIAPSLRGSAASLSNTFNRQVGFALDPLVVGFVSDRVRGDLGLRLLILTPSCLLLSAASMGLGLRTMKRDVENMDQGWARRDTSSGSVGASVLPEVEPVPAGVARIRRDAAP